MRVAASYPVCRRLPPRRRLVTLEQTDFCPRPFSEGLPGQLLLSARAQPLGAFGGIQGVGHGRSRRAISRGRAAYHSCYLSAMSSFSRGSFVDRRSHDFSDGLAHDYACRVPWQPLLSVCVPPLDFAPTIVYSDLPS